MIENLEFRLLSDKDFDQIESLIDSNKFLSGRFMERYKGVEAINDYSMALYKSEWENDASFIYGLFDHAQLQIAGILKPLFWDSEIYGVPMASIEYILGNEKKLSENDHLLKLFLQNVEQYAREANFKFLLCKTFTNQINLIHALQLSNFMLVDTLLDYVYDYNYRPLDLIERPNTLSQIIVRDAVEDDLEQLLNLSAIAFQEHFGRYHSDIRTSKKLATEIYQQWIRSSMEGYADRIIIAEVHNEISAYSVWRYPQKQNDVLGRIGHYSIAGVHPNMSGKNLFRVLTYSGMDALKEMADYIVGPTHINNYAVQRGYESLGWRIHDARHSFHKWLD